MNDMNKNERLDTANSRF